MIKRIAILCLGLASILPAQVTTSQISGTVSDSSGARVPAVTVRVISEGTKLDRTVTSNPDGFYIATNLQPGTYKVRVEGKGFKAYERAGIELTAGDRVDVSMTLDIGNVSETVTVEAHGESVETDNPSLGRLVDGEQVRELALDGRNLIQMVMLMPGVAATTDQFDRGGIATGSVADFAINGTRPTSTAVTVDGGSNQDTGNITGQTNNVSVDFVREVKVASSAYSAEYGRQAGAAINFTTRGGTEQYHGTLFEFFRNDKLNARSFFAPKVEELRLNQFGWNLGGQVLIPGLIGKKQKLFFFVGEEYRRRVDGQTNRVTFPTHAERSGISTSTGTLRYPANFSDPALAGQLITDPTRATAANPTGKNILPLQYQTANGQAIMRIYDAMEKLSSLYTDVASANNTTFQLANTDIRREDVVRLDYQPSERNQIYGRFLYDTGSGFSPYEMGSVPTFQATRRNLNPNLQLAWTSVISSRSINEAAIVSNYFNLYRLPYGDQRLPQTYGLKINELFGNEDQVYGIPAIPISGYSTLSGARDTRDSPVWDFSVRDNFSRLIGKHLLKTGFLGIRNRKNQRVYFTTGSLNFNTSGNTNSTGNALFDALLGNYQQYTETNKEKWTRIRMTQIEGYVQETWKALPNLTLDLGARYQFLPPPTVTDDTVSTFLPSLFDPAKARQVIPAGTNAGQLVTGVGDPYNGIAVAGSSFKNSKDTPTDPAALNLFRGLPSGFYKNQHKVSPRLGIAWDPSRKGTFSIRGGVAIYYDRLNNGDLTEAGGNPPFVNTVTLFNGALDNLGSGRNAQFPVAISSFRPDIEAPAIYKWSFGFQKKLPWGMLADVNYVSTQGRHLMRKPNINIVAPAVQYANSAANINSIRPYQGYTNIGLWETSAASNYHGLQTSLTRRYSKKFTYSVAYTFSKVLADASGTSEAPESLLDYHRERSHASFDRNQVLVISYIYNLPLLKRAHPVLHWVAGGWQLSGISQFQTGAWLSPSISTPTGTRRPNRVGDVQYMDPRVIRTLQTGNNIQGAGNFYFDPTPGTTFIAPAPDRYGNSSPYIIRGPGRNNWDLSVFKNFKPREKVNVQFRGEFFNVWNHASFRNPNVNASDRNYGTISDAGPPRLVQFALKLTF